MYTYKLVLLCMIVGCVYGTMPTVRISERTTEAMMNFRRAHEKQVEYSPGQNKFTVQGKSGTRTYYVWVPKGYDGSKAVPLLFAYHGLGDNCLNFGPAVGFSKYADQYNFLYVYPCSTVGILGSCWNSGVCCCEGNGADDIDFTQKMIAQLSSNFKVDSSRVFASGFSNGAFMAEILGCVMADTFKATASVSGVVELQPGNSGGLQTCTTDYGKASKQVSTINIHGDADFVVPWTGDALLGFPPIPDDFSAWGDRNGCTGKPVQTFSKGAFSNQVYQTCKGNTTVELVKNHGGGHEWPMSSDFDTTSYIVNFFGLNQ